MHIFYTNIIIIGRGYTFEIVNIIIENNTYLIINIIYLFNEKTSLKKKFFF